MTVSEQKKQRNSFKTSFKPMLMARDALVMDPGMTSRKLPNVSQALVMEEDTEERLSSLVASEHQGEVIRGTEFH